MLKTLRLFVLTLFLLPLSVFARNAEFTDPAPIEVPAKLNAGDVQKAVMETLDGYRWTTKSLGGGKLEALYASRGLSAKVAVSYSAKQITIKYLDSQGLDFEAQGEKRFIHPTYQRWIGNLVKGIQTRMTQAEFTK